MTIKINKSLLPLKFHFFIFWASYSSALPFMMVVARQLGIPVGVQGTVTAAIITAAVLAKPIISAAADYLPVFRKAIFLGLLTIMVMTIGPIGLLSPMYPPPEFSGQLLPADFPGSENMSSSDSYLRTEGTDPDSCIVKIAWDCKASCIQHEICPFGNTSIDFLKMTYQRTKIEESVASLIGIEDNRTLDIRYSDSIADSGDLYKLEGISSSLSDTNFSISVRCAGGERIGEGCVAPWHTLEFWFYVTLLLAGQISATTAESISDAICLDTIGEDGDYGSQRAWGALSYGIFGTLSGLLVDWHSGSNFMKDYTPAFLLLVVFGTVDVLLSAAYLKVPKFGAGKAMWANLRPLLLQPRFLVFLVFAFLIGFYDGVDTGYVFILQEDMAAGTSLMKNMKLLQGLTMLVEALSAAPFMFVYDWFKKKMGAQKVITLVLFLYTIRLLGLALAGYMKLVWATIAIEVINGPCFGLGFTAVIDHASSITPPGTSATVQSFVSICYGTFGYAGASLIGGILYEAVGGIWLYGISGIIAAVTCVLHMISLKLLSPPPGNTIESPEHKEEMLKGSQNNLNSNGLMENLKNAKKENGSADLGNEEENMNLLQRSANGGNVELKEMSSKERESECLNPEKNFSCDNTKVADTGPDNSLPNV